MIFTYTAAFFFPLPPELNNGGSGEEEKIFKDGVSAATCGVFRIIRNVGARRAPSRGKLKKNRHL